MLWYLRLDFASAQPSRIGAEYVDCTSRIGAEWGAEFAELPSIIRRGLACACVCMCVHACVCVCMRVCARVCVCMRVHPCTSMLVYRCILQFDIFFM